MDPQVREDISDALTDRGYHDTGEAPCPNPGHEDCHIYHTTDDGQSAVWSNGHDYVRDSSSEPAPSRWTH